MEFEPAASDLVICSSAMAQAYATAHFLRDSNISVLIYGESGVGKSRLAEVVRARGPFVRVDCNAIPADLFASELFGYMPNAFTGASNKRKVGLLEAAHLGTILFDEINELSLENQVLLLHFLQNHTILPIGGLESRKVETRVISTAGRDLRRMIQEGSFRQDLYYRLCVSRIYIPPLRERREAIPALIQHFIEKYAAEYGVDQAQIRLTPGQLERLAALDWMGNIREVENFVQQLCFWSDVPDGIEECIQKLSQSIRLEDVGTFVPETAVHKPLKAALREFEASYLQTVLAETPDLPTAARELGISLRTLNKKKAELGLVCPSPQKGKQTKEARK